MKPIYLSPIKTERMFDFIVSVLREAGYDWHYPEVEMKYDPEWPVIVVQDLEMTISIKPGDRDIIDLTPYEECL